jgi:hypothetical protein
MLRALAELQEGNVAPLMALLAKDGSPIKCWRCGGNHFKGDCCHPASAEELAYPGDYSKWPKPGEAGRVRVRQPPQLPPDHASMAEMRQELREMRREMALLRLHLSGPSEAPSTSTLMNLTIEARAPAAAPAIFCALRGAAPPPGYIIIQEDPLHVWFAPANLGPEALEQATAAWEATGYGGEPAAL